MANTLERITSEPAVILIILTSLIFFKTTFEKEVGTEIVSIYQVMITLVIVMFFLKKEGIITSEIRQIQGNSGESLLYAGGALIGFSALYSLVNTLFRQSILPIQATAQQLNQSVFQSVFSGLVKFSSVDFSQLTPIKYYLFGFVIPITETLTIIGLMVFLTWIFNESLSIKNPRLHAIIILISSLFMFFHLKVRGINNNIDLVMTFLFAYLSLLMAAYLKESEAPNEFHIGTNLLALIYGR